MQRERGHLLAINKCPHENEYACKMMMMMMTKGWEPTYILKCRKDGSKVQTLSHRITSHNSHHTTPHKSPYTQIYYAKAQDIFTQMLYDKNTMALGVPDSTYYHLMGLFDSGEEGIHDTEDGGDNDSFVNEYDRKSVGMMNNGWKPDG
jgi:hypothetical protein